MHHIIPYIIVSMFIFLLIGSVITLAKTESKVYLDEKNNAIDKEMISKPRVIKKKVESKQKTVAKLSEHISAVVDNSVNEKKHLNKRKRKTVS